MKDKDKHFNGTLEVTGTGRIVIAPDEATIELSVLTEAKTAGEAVAANATLTQAVVDAVSGEPNHGVTTQGLNVGPIVEYSGNSSKIVGFRASNGVDVKTKIGYAGQIFDAGIKAGANQSSGISFGLRDDSQIREDALRIAVKAAYSEARIVAKAAEIDIEGPESISIESGPGRIAFRAVAIDEAGPPTPVRPGDLTISAGVRIVFRTRA
ncbi:SIMPL domain-containing protein [Nannocystaceae bacterium ST9]